MKNHNVMDLHKYIYEHIYWSLVAMLIYRRTYFCNVSSQYVHFSLGYTNSKLFLWGLVLIFVCLGILLTSRKRRNNLSLTVNILLPFEIYALLSLQKYFPNWVWIFIICTLIFVSIYIFLMLFRRIPENYQNTSIFSKRIFASLLGSRTIITIAFSIPFVLFIASSFLGNSFISSSIKPTSINDEISYLTAENIEFIDMLDESIWQGLNNQEKIDILQIIANIEVATLKLPTGLKVEANMLDTSTRGYYDNRTLRIIIDINHLTSSCSYDVLKTLLHEIHHAYQYRYVEAYLSIDDEYKNLPCFSEAAIYAEELSDYCDGSDNIFEYYYQNVEIDARNYAEDKTKEYFVRIKEISTYK